MNQFWTIIFFVVFAAAFGIACWHDRDDRKRLEQRGPAIKGGGDDGD